MSTNPNAKHEDGTGPTALERAAAIPTGPGWARRHAAGLACSSLGVAALAITMAVHLGSGQELTKIPDVRLTAPFLVAAVVAMTAALVRREGAYALPVTGVVLAAAAAVLGWALVLAVVAGVALVVILIISEMM